jgi:CheY-like chemotaxis protein
MMSDLELNFADGPNLEKLITTVLKASRVKNRDLRVLTRDEFVAQFITGHKDYVEIVVVTSLQQAMDSSESAASGGDGDGPGAIPGDRLLHADEASRDGTVQLRFDSEPKPKLTLDEIRESLRDLRIAVVDDDFVIQELIKNTFQRIGAAVSTYSNGAEFLAVAEKEQFSLVFLDLMMPKVDGFSVLRTMHVNRIEQPVIILSSVIQRESVIRAFQMGVKSYLVKPLKPDDIFKKTLEILKANF